MRRVLVASVSAALLASGCSSGDAWVRAVERSSTGVDGLPATSSSVPTDPNALNARQLVEALAADELTGRDNQTPGSAAAQALIVEQLAQFAEPAVGDTYLQPLAEGTNILGLIRGGDLADEFVVIGAHYDHIGSDCVSADPADHICNGATDNATGVAAVISIARAIAAQGTPRRSVLVALWDAEEDGLRGSDGYVRNPIVPLASTVVYLNFDIQGATLLPSLANVTFAIGAETGGDALSGAVAHALEQSTLQPLTLSSFLFHGRSDHASFARMGVPATMFSDATGGCYHTAQDETDIVDFAKLDQQVAVGAALVLDLANTDTPPTPNGGAPTAVFADAVALLAFVEQAEPDLGLFSPPAAAQLEQFRKDLQAVVDAGPEAFADVAAMTIMTGVDLLVESLTQTACANYAA